MAARRALEQRITRLLVRSVRHRRALWVTLMVLLALALAAIGLCGRFGNDVSQLFPEGSESGTAFRWMRRSGLANKVILEFTPPAEQSLPELEPYLTELAEHLARSPLIESVDFRFRADQLLETAQKLVAAVPLITSPEMLSAAVPAETVDRIYRQLLKPGLGSGEFLRLDPFGLTPPILAQLTKLQELSGLAFSPELPFPATVDGRRAALLLDVRPACSEISGSRELLTFLRQELATVPPGVTTRILAPHVRTVGNEEVIKRDLGVAGALSLLLLPALFLYCYRASWPSLWIPLLPVLAGILALGGLSLVLDEIYFFVIGMGGAVVGLAVDYGIHIYAARRGRSGLRRVGRIALPVAAGATTSCGVFLLLTGTGIAAYRQLGIYAAMALALSLLLSLMLLPGLLGSRGGRCRELRGVTWSPRQRRVVLLIWGGLLLLALPAAMKIHFSTGMEQFDGAPAEVRRDEAEFNAAWRRAPAPAVVIELADSLPELETRLEQRYRQLLPLAGESEIFGPSALWPAPEVRARNLAAWRAWLDSGHGGALFRELRRAAVARGFDPTFFAPFEQTLKAGIAAGEQQVLPEPIDSCLKRTRRRTPEGGWAGVLLVRDTPETVRQVRAALAAEPGAAVLSPVAFEQMLGTEFGQRFRYLLPSALVLIAVCAIFFLGSWRRALAALSVPATALLLVLGGYAWWGVELNMVSAFAGLVLAGLAIDYGIFAVHACAEGRHSGLWTALLLSAATTFVTGAAVLFSRHPVLFYTGLTLSLGILIAWLTAVLAVPALPRRWLAGCAGVLLLTVVGGCRTPAFTRGALPELEPEQALREYRQWRERGMEAATWEAGLVFEYGFWQFPLLTVGQVEPAAEALRLVGLSPAGGTVFELAGRGEKLESVATLPFLKLEDPEAAGRVLYRDFANLYFGNAPAVEPEVRGQFLYSTVELSDGDRLRYTFGGRPLRLLQKSRSGFWHERWRAEYYEYQWRHGRWFPGEIDYENVAGGYRLIVRPRRLTEEEK